MGTVATTSITELPLWAMLAVSAVGGAIVACVGALVFNRLMRPQREAARGGDSVTGVGSRREFISELEQGWVEARGGDDSIGLLLVDIDRFGEINHLYGRGTGDRVLAEVAERIRLRVRSSDFVARVDADEFGVVCRGVELEQLEAMRENLEAYVNFAQTVPVHLSIGIASPENWDESCLELIDRARGSLAQRRAVRPEQAVDEALAALITPR
ncbi:MAG: GGDEF domain-containing protein [Solirubrobacterales bacterium]